MTDDKEQIERVAEAIYRNSSCEPEEFERIYGKKMRVWKTDSSWNIEPASMLGAHDLAEHVRDDFRRMARAAIDAMRTYTHAAKAFKT